MDVKTVCLGMLTDGPACGYDLKKHFESSFGHFFAAGYGSIYPALSTLADQGHVSCEHMPQEGKPDRKIYEITENGKAFLLEALDDPAPSHKVRSEFLATLCFAHLMTNDQVETVLNSIVSEIDLHQEIIAGMQTNCAHNWPPGKCFVAGFGKTIIGAMKKYIEENRHMLADDAARKVAAR
jgi:PadR family transcriptional regulator AphA